MDYQAGGGLPPGANCYVKRQADDALFAGLRDGEFCYVLNSRQMGKSSLRFEVQRRLVAEGAVCAVVDLQAIGKQMETPLQWYAGVVSCLAESLPVLAQTVNWRNWWRDHEMTSPVQRLGEFMRGVMLPAFPQQRVVVLIDEIDSVLGLPFSLDDFFGLLRACYQQSHGGSQQLTFALFGVATPSGLVSAGASSPFNIGRAISLGGFTFAEARGLASGLAVQAENPEGVLREILHWTGGQPFLTQKLCQLVQESKRNRIVAGEEADRVGQLVQRCIIENWEAQDEPEHLRTVRNRILAQGDKLAGRLLGIYRQVWQQGSVGTQALAAEDVAELRLSGLLVKQGEQLQIHNPIYREVFDADWFEFALGELRSDLYAEAIKVWFASDRQDESVLLRGQTLQAALDWKKDRQLNQDDEAFLEASRVWGQREVQRQLAIEQEEKGRLAEANRTVRKRLAMGSLILIASLIAAGVLSIFASRQASLAQRSKETAEVAERQAVAANAERDKSLRAVEDSRAAEEDALNNLREKEIELGQTQQELVAAETAVAAVNEQVLVAEAQVVAAGEDSAAASAAAQRARDEQQVAEIARGQAERATDVAQGELNIAQEGTAIERLAASSLRKLAQNSYVALLEAVRAGSQLQVLVQENEFSRLSDYPTVMPLLALQQVQAIIQQPAKVIARHEASLIHASLNSDGQRIVTALADGTARVWTSEGQPIATIEGHEDSVNYASFSPDNHRIVTASADGTARVWTSEGQPIATVEGHLPFVYSHVPFSPDSQRIVTASGGGIARVWTHEGQLIATLEGHENLVIQASFSPNGQRIVTASGDDTARVWTHEGQPIATLEGHEDIIWHASFSPDSQRIVTASADGTARLWTVDGQLITAFEGHKSSVRYASFSPDGQRIVTVSDGTARLWTIEGQLIEKHGGHEGSVRHASFSPDGQRIVTASNDGIVKLWPVGGLRFAKNEEHEGPINYASFSPDSQRIVTASDDGTARLWTVDGQLITAFEGHESSVRHASFSPDGQRIVTASWDGTARLWTVDGQLIAALVDTLVDSGSMSVSQASFSPDGKRIVTASWDGTARIWTAEGDLITRLEGGDEVLLLYSFFSPDSRHVVTLTGANSMELWTAEGELIVIDTGHETSVRHVSFSPDGQSIVTASNDGTARLWTVDGQLITAFEGHEDSVSYASFSPDGQRIVTASWDGTARLWTIEGETIARFEGHKDKIIHASFSPDGQRIVTVSDDGTARLWPVQTLDQLVSESCTWLRTYHEYGNTVSDSDLALCDIPP